MCTVDEPKNIECAQTADQRKEPADSGFAITIGQTRASDLAERYLRSLIFSGRLVPGDKLPSERELAAQFGIARITLRSALRSLETVGFLVIKIGSKGGAWINDAATIMARWQDWMRTHQHEIDEMLEYRRIIETQIASLAAARRTDEELDILEKVSTPPRRDETVSQWHFDFHDALAKAAHNRYLEQAMFAIRGELFVPTDWVMTSSRAQDIENVHDHILAAVRDGDPERAAVEMGKHLDAADAPFNQVLGE
jgi:GntR family transcriptional repressor for pyruvate dehydrogenase complex